MGQSKSKIKKPKNAVDMIEYRALRRRQKQIEEEKRRIQLEKERNKAIRKKTKNNKGKKNDGLKNNESNLAISATNYKVAFRMEDYDNQVSLKLEEQIANKFAHFCLNQIILSTQFYGNYQSEKSLAADQVLRKEAEQNQNLDKHSILLPNILDEAVQSRVQYKPKHGPDKYELSPLQLQTMYIIFENVEISKPDDANYDSINPICKVDIDTNVGRSKKFKGYLRLQLRETNGQTQSKNTLDNDKISESSIDFYFHNGGIYNGVGSRNELKLPTSYEPQYDTLRMPRDSNSSGIDVSGSEYAYITNLNTHQPLSELCISKKLKSEIFDAKVVPESCITVVEYYADEAYADDDDDDDDDSEVDVIEVKYLNSKSFFCYFATVLKDHLAQDLDLCDIEFDRATWKGASIFTKSYEIIPAVHIGCWPDCAFEWLHRTRSILQNPLNGQQLQWPTQEMIKKVESFGCHVIPMGYAPKTSKNPYRELEWKIVFPKAERFLESHLTDTQVKVFMISKVLIKTFLEQKRDIFMFTMDHLRMHLFWECEKNFGAWPEEFLGEVLLRFLSSFLERTRSKCLPDYFITGRNLFECIPESTLVRIHQIISQIVQNPVMHLLAAYRNLEQLEPFFPKLNYKKLYAIITVNNPLHLMDQLKTCIRRNALLIQMKDESSNNKKKEDYILAGYEDNNSDEENRGIIGFSHKQERKRQSRKSKRLKSNTRQNSIRKKIREAKPIKRVSIDSIDLQQYIFAKNLNELAREKRKNIPIYDDIRRSLTIEMFIRQFIHQAKSSYDLKSLDKARIYLNQAGRLCNFLAKYDHEENAKKFLKKIDAMKISYGSLSQTNIDPEHPPALPERTSLEPVKSFRLGDFNNSSPMIIRRQRNDSSNDEQTPRSDKVRSVHFDDFEDSFEPRSFTFEADIHRPISMLRVNNNEDSYQERNKKRIMFDPVESKSVTIQDIDSFIQKPKKQVSIEENIIGRKSILRTNSKETTMNGRIPNGILKQTSVESYSKQNVTENNMMRYAPSLDDIEATPKPSYSSATTTSEIEEITEGLTFKELFERRKSVIHRKLTSSGTFESNGYSCSSESEDENGNSTKL